jgi:hypothetical protein
MNLVIYRHLSLIIGAEENSPEIRLLMQISVIRFTELVNKIKIYTNLIKLFHFEIHISLFHFL